jgi:hypothetical protein
MEDEMLNAAEDAIDDAVEEAAVAEVLHADAVDKAVAAEELRAVADELEAEAIVEEASAEMLAEVAVEDVAAAEMLAEAADDGRLRASRHRRAHTFREVRRNIEACPSSTASSQSSAGGYGTSAMTSRTGPCCGRRDLAPIHGPAAARSKLGAPCRVCSPGAAAGTTRPASTAGAASMRAIRSRWSRGNVRHGCRPP